MLYTEGLILKPTGTGDGFTAISTGDNYGLPRFWKSVINKTIN